MSPIFQILIRTIIVLLGGLLAVTAFSENTADLSEFERKEIAERIAPVGKACENGQPCAEKAVTTVKSSSSSRSGEKIFNSSCSVCHANGLLGAPKKGDTEAWKARIKKLGGFDKLLSNAINGIGNMPARGACMDCSDEEIKKALEYMSDLSP
ncbi:MAG: c-type cytochrome [Candidatus Endonucleobacter sp. (ex Gigantidas childressi)]|nr:c-type cytochrome [Candidatus Endonucleobacter sp. (ex Gigantidas childressi)]